MKVVLVASIVFVAQVAAQSRSDIPSCALPCLDSSVKMNTSCDTDDFTCICQNFDVIRSDAASCIVKACGQDATLNTVLPATQKLCNKVESSGSKPSSAQVSSSPASSTMTADDAPTAAPATSTAGAVTFRPVGIAVVLVFGALLL